jgi:hypothetical protein
MLKIVKRFSLTSALSISLIISPTFAAGPDTSTMQEMQQLQQKMQKDMESMKADQLKLQQQRIQLEKDRMELMKLKQKMAGERMQQRQQPQQ